MNNPYDILKERRWTEKTLMLQNLAQATSNKSLAKCQSPKLVFNVHPKANKTQIAWAVEQVFREKNVKVTSVRTITIKPKPKRVRGRRGKTASGKKAIITLRPEDQIDEAV